MYRVIIDSCGELFPEMLEDERFMNVPLTLEVGGEVIIDDEGFDQKSFLGKVKASPRGPKSSCPSPGKYLEAISKRVDKLMPGNNNHSDDKEHVYIVTLSAELSGSYNSAVVAKGMYEEAHDDKCIYVFNFIIAFIMYLFKAISTK